MAEANQESGYTSEEIQQVVAGGGLHRTGVYGPCSSIIWVLMRKVLTYFAVLLLGGDLGVTGLTVKRRLEVAPIEIHEVKVSVYQALREHADVFLLGGPLTHWGEWSQMLPGLRLANRGLPATRWCRPPRAWTQAFS